MKSLDIKVERTGFPFRLADHEFFFDCSAENIEKYYSNWEKAQKELEDLTNSKEKMDIEDSLNALDKAYGLIIGENKFKELYEEMPDIISWQQAFVRLANGIHDNVQDFLKKQTEESKKIKKEYILKQARKKG